MDEPGQQRLVLVCGAPGAGKKAILDALAKHMGTTLPTAIRLKSEFPQQVTWEAGFPRGGRARFETFYGPGFRHERAIAEQFARPASSVIYVLRQMQNEFPMSIETEQEYFDTHVTEANKHRRSWREVPWLFVKAQSWPLDPCWLTELIPRDLADLAITVNAASGAGVPELFNTLDRLLMRD